MTAVTICSDFGAQENKVCHCFHCLPIYLPWSDGTRCHDLSFLKVELLEIISEKKNETYLYKVIRQVGYNWSDLACMNALEKEMATHSNILTWRIPGTEKPGGLPSVEAHRVGCNWSDLAAAAAAIRQVTPNYTLEYHQHSEKRIWVSKKSRIS